MMIATPDGRQLEVLVSGAEDGYPLVFHYGTPSAALPYAPIDDAAADAGLRMVTWSRPGYGESTPRTSRPGTLAGDVADTATVLDALGMGEFVTLGWSGGGPRAIACAALLPGRCRAATSLAGIAPYDGAGLDFYADMGPENVRDFEAASQGVDAFTSLGEQQAEEFSNVTAEDLVAAFGGLVDEVDAAALTGEHAEFIASSFRKAATQGAVGMVDDNVLLAQPWCFDLGAITVPVAVWQGRHDKMVPFGHGEWLADAIPGARKHLFDDEGHLTLLRRMPEMFAELRELAGLG